MKVNPYTATEKDEQRMFQISQKALKISRIVNITSVEVDTTVDVYERFPLGNFRQSRISLRRRRRSNRIYLISCDHGCAIVLFLKLVDGDLAYNVFDSVSYVG